MKRTTLLLVFAVAGFNIELAHAATVADTPSPTTARVHHHVKKAASNTVSKTKSGVASARDSADQGLGSVKSGVHDAGSSARDAGDNALGKVSKAISGN